MKIVQSVLPTESILLLENKKYDFVDSFAGKIIDGDSSVTIQQVGKAFFTSSPTWVDKLFTLRNKIVSIFGLKTSGKITNRKTQLDHFKCEVGEQLGLFKVFSCTKNEVIIGEDDKHLNFRVSLYIEDDNTSATLKNLVISTTVEFNNWFGKLYFLPVRPFHKLIVPVMLKGIIKALKQ
jgi:hypothetical protein